MTCSQSRGYEDELTEWVKEGKLVVIDTHPDKVTLVWKGELSIECGVMVDYEVHSQGYNVKKLIKEQNRIG